MTVLKVLFDISLMVLCFSLGVMYGVKIPKEKYYLMGWNDCKKNKTHD